MFYYGVNNYYLFLIVIFEVLGVWVKDLEGNEYMDMLSVYFVVN